MRVDESFARAALLAAACSLAGLAAGCGPRVAPTGEVFGKVTVEGKPVTAGVVKFFPEDGGAAVETALGPDGSYRATGVPVGRNLVAIETLKFKNLTPPPPAIAKQLGGPRTTYVPIPAKYEKYETSGLTFDVEKGAKEWNIEL
jgi:hypothetical protein